MKNTIVQGDCLEVMRDIPDNSIDMILCDLPYGTTACAWDSIIPFEPLWAHYKRIIKDRGAVVLTGSQPFTTDLIMSNREWFKYEDIWNKVVKTGHLNAKIMPMRHHESVLLFSPSPLGGFTYNSQMKKDRFRQKGGEGKNGGVYGNHKMQKVWNDVIYPGSVIEISKGSQKNNLHPTQKPVALFSYLIKTYTNPGDLVLDNCIGSGTTAISCIETGRDFIGIEQDPGYCEIARQRITERLQQPFLFDVREEKPNYKQAEFA